jgi:D-alanyl-lipoteichoic acid acyltransferase DltB (MBOAT superfamily)
VVIADNMALLSNPVFHAAENKFDITFWEAWGGALAYTFQLYFDFSGYADMAIGAALLFGIKLPLNFWSPYKAVNIIDFWRRWHITLSRFLRDYLYIPLGGNRNGDFNKYRNLMFTMLLGGLWHGAGWNFVIWGGLHGTYLMINHLWLYILKDKDILPQALKWFGTICSWLVTFLAVVVAWVFFRAESFKGAIEMVSSMIQISDLLHVEGLFYSIVNDNVIAHFGNASGFLFIFAAMALVVFFPNSSEIADGLTQKATKKIGNFSLSRSYIMLKPLMQREWLMSPFIALCLVSSLLLLTRVSEFIYFRF